MVSRGKEAVCAQAGDGIGGVASFIKNILYGKSKNPGIVILKMPCDGFGAPFAPTKDEQIASIGLFFAQKYAILPLSRKRRGI